MCDVHGGLWSRQSVGYHVISTRPVQYRTGGCVRKSDAVKGLLPLFTLGAKLISGSKPVYFVQVIRFPPGDRERDVTGVDAPRPGRRSGIACRQLAQLPERGILVRPASLRLSASVIAAAWRARLECGSYASWQSVFENPQRNSSVPLC